MRLVWSHRIHAVKPDYDRGRHRPASRVRVDCRGLAERGFRVSFYKELLITSFDPATADTLGFDRVGCTMD